PHSKCWRVGSTPSGCQAYSSIPSAAIGAPLSTRHAQRGRLAMSCSSPLIGPPLVSPFPTLTAPLPRDSLLMFILSASARPLPVPRASLPRMLPPPAILRPGLGSGDPWSTRIDADFRRSGEQPAPEPPPPAAAQAASTPQHTTHQPAQQLPANVPQA